MQHGNVEEERGCCWDCVIFTRIFKLDQIGLTAADPVREGMDGMDSLGTARHTRTANSGRTTDDGMDATQPLRVGAVMSMR